MIPQGTFSKILIPSVKGRPFQADSRIVDASGTATGKLFRDGLGRVRRDTNIFVPQISRTFVVSLIRDPEGQVALILDHHNKTAKKAKLPESLAPPEHPPEQPSSNAKLPPGTEALGSKMVGGVLCRGFRRRADSSSSEWWVSSELDMIVYSKAEGKEETWSFELYNIKVGPPDESVFKIPEDFSVEDQ